MMKGKIMSQIAIIKTKYIVNKKTERKLFDFFNKALNEKHITPDNNFFNEYSKPEIAKKFFYDLRYYEVPEKTYSKNYSDWELERISNLIIDELEKNKQRKYSDKKYIEEDIDIFECVREASSWLGKIKYKIVNLFSDIKKNRIKEQLLRYKSTTFDSKTGALYINTQFSNNSKKAWFDEIEEFLELNRDKSKRFMMYINYDYGTFVDFFENGSFDRFRITAEAEDEIYDHNGFFGARLNKLPDELPFKINWTDYKDVKMLEKYMKEIVGKNE